MRRRWQPSGWSGWHSGYSGSRPANRPQSGSAGHDGGAGQVSPVITERRNSACLGGRIGQLPCLRREMGYASIAWLLKFVAKHSFNAFVTYRVVIGVALPGLPATGALNA